MVDDCIVVRDKKGTAVLVCFFFQAEDGIRDLVRSRGLGDVYKRQIQRDPLFVSTNPDDLTNRSLAVSDRLSIIAQSCACLLYTSDAADERSSVDLGGRRIIKKKNSHIHMGGSTNTTTHLKHNN